MDSRQHHASPTTTTNTSREHLGLPRQDGTTSPPRRPSNRLRRREHSGSSTLVVLPSSSTINDQYLPPEMRGERERVLGTSSKAKRRPSPSGRSSSSRDGTSRSRPLSGVLSYGPDIRDLGSQTGSRPRSAEVQPVPFSPSRSPVPREHHERLSVPFGEVETMSRSDTSTPQLPARVSDAVGDDPPPDYESLVVRPVSSSSTLPLPVSSPISPSDLLPEPHHPLPQSTADHSQLPTSPFFPFGIVATDPSATVRPGRRPLPSVPDTRRSDGALGANAPALPRRVSQVSDRADSVRRGDSDGGLPSPASGRFLDMTDLDWVVSRLEQDETAREVDYETLLTLEEIMGRSGAAPRPNPLGRAGLKPSRVVEESRRYNAEGKLKLKLSLGGVRVERCGICLAQFVAGDLGVMLRCRHPFHFACLERWTAIKESCPSCRSPLGGS